MPLTDWLNLDQSKEGGVKLFASYRIGNKAIWGRKRLPHIRFDQCATAF